MSKKQVSLKDIAQEMKVSVSTVSRALKNHPDISTELCKKIQDLAELRHYSPNPLAMGLLRQQTRTIGVIVPDIVTYFYASIINGIEEVASKHGHYVVVTSSNELYENEKRCIRNLQNLRVEGMIVCLSQETSDYSHFDVFKENEIPLVFFDRICRTSEFSSVIVDNIEAARKITMHLFETGSKRIAHIAGPAHLNITQERIEGYKIGLINCGIKFDKDLLVFSKLDYNSATTATQKLLSLNPKPDAIFGINDTVVFAAMKEIKKQGLRVPHNISLVGFTDDFHATFMEPELTSMRHPAFEMGQEAANLLIQQATSDIFTTPKQIILQPTLVIRESSVKN
jgi:DNA-binding LacI/PurR family transcriptional regulator